MRWYATVCTMCGTAHLAHGAPLWLVLTVSVVHLAVGRFDVFFLSGVGCSELLEGQCCSNYPIVSAPAFRNGLGPRFASRRAGGIQTCFRLFFNFKGGVGVVWLYRFYVITRAQFCCSTSSQYAMLTGRWSSSVA